MGEGVLSPNGERGRRPGCFVARTAERLFPSSVLVADMLSMIISFVPQARMPQDEMIELEPEKDLSDYLPKWCETAPRHPASRHLRAVLARYPAGGAPAFLKRRFESCNPLCEPFLCAQTLLAVSSCRFGYSAVYIVSAIPVFITIAALSLLFISSLK